MEDQSKLWYELGNTMGLVVVSSEEEEEEEKMEEDKEVEQIYQKGKETKRKILKGMSIMSNALIILVQYSTVPVVLLNQINVKHVKLNVF